MQQINEQLIPKSRKGIKTMATIFCITEWNDKMEQTRSEHFMSLNGVANWLTKLKPISNQFKDTTGIYDITAENLEKVLNVATALSMGALFSIKQDICGFEFETRFTLSTIEVND